MIKLSNSKSLTDRVNDQLLNFVQYRPAFLPDPKDGSIYMIGASLKDPLKKLPFTIPELVAASPCKSSDGTLYTGKKVDTWFSIDRFTGRKKVIRIMK